VNEEDVNPFRTRHNTTPFFDREKERRCLREAILHRQSLLICGPAGSGKTSLVAEVVNGLPHDVARSTFYVSGIDGLQPLLRALLRELYDVDDPPLRRQLHAEGIRNETFKAWLRSLPTSRLKGTLYRSAESGRYWVIVDHVPPPTHAVAKVVKELARMRDTPVYLLARGQTQAEVGHVTDLFWGDKHHLSLRPLPEPVARALLESCIRRFGLVRLDLEGFREEVLRLSGQVPGTLVKMCALAAEPRYQYGARIKTRLVHIDCMMSRHGLLPASRTLAGDQRP
jgi:energy-coupling factor transporter ATP-binding protein EcfA2